MSAQLITAAFFMEGMHAVKPGYDAVITAWGQGCIEMVDALVSYVSFSTMLCDAASLARDGIYPGVFDYEVSVPFGKWFGEYILINKDVPPRAEAQTWLINNVTAFFTQGLTGQNSEDVRVAINQLSL